MSDFSHDVACQLSEQRRKPALENRERLFPLVETIPLCGKHGIALCVQGMRGRVQSRDVALSQLFNKVSINGFKMI